MGEVLRFPVERTRPCQAQRTRELLDRADQFWDRVDEFWREVDHHLDAATYSSGPESSEQLQRLVAPPPLITRQELQKLAGRVRAYLSRRRSR